jgi:hypothetical protein
VRENTERRSIVVITYEEEIFGMIGNGREEWIYPSMNLGRSFK